MNTAIILAGGSGSRMKDADVPKPYIMAGGKPVISYCLHTFETTEVINRIVIVADYSFHKFIEDWISKENITKFAGFANPGRTRQHSIYNALLKVQEIAEENEIVIIHDAARPLVSQRIILDCINAAKISDGAMPVLHVKDTIYMSEDGKHIKGLLNRDELFAGQAPESFRFYKYLSIHQKMTDEEIGLIKGSSEAAYKYGMQIELVEGSEENFKITTMEDLHKFKLMLENN